MIKRIRRRLAWWLWKPDTISIGSRLRIDSMGATVTVTIEGVRFEAGRGRLLTTVLTCHEDLRGE